MDSKMAGDGEMTSSSDASFVACDVNSWAQLDAELEQNGQTYFDKEEEEDSQAALVKNRDDNPDKASSTESCLLCGFSWGQIKWSNVIWLALLHGLFIWAFGYASTHPIKLHSAVWTAFTAIFSGFGMSVGAHRYWAHRSFKATPFLRFVLLVLQTMTINGSAFSYARDHRNHHKWPATDADPKNPGRGFFYAHIGWWMLKKRPEVAQFGTKVPIDDLLEERMLMLQHRFYLPLVFLLAILLPVLLPVLLWEETLLASSSLTTIRLLVVIHHLWTVNSVSHFFGSKPYNRFQKPTENRFINWISMGEGNHNYHHQFPFHFNNGELAWWEVFNPASLYIEVCILLRLASEPKKPSKHLIRKVIEAKGKPEYFVDIRERSLLQRIAIGMLDWACGILLAQWPMWVIIAYKAASGLPLIIL